MKDVEEEYKKNNNTHIERIYTWEEVRRCIVIEAAIGTTLHSLGGTELPV